MDEYEEIIRLAKVAEVIRDLKQRLDAVTDDLVRLRKMYTFEEESHGRVDGTGGARGS